MVDETDIRNLALGQPAEIRVDALRGREDQGRGHRDRLLGHPARRHARRRQAPIRAPQTRRRTSRSRSRSRTRRPRSRPGLNATADITTARKEKVLAVPIQAVVVREVDKEGKVVDPDAVQAAETSDPQRRAAAAKGEEKEGVFVVNDGQAAFRPVKTGIIGETDIEITRGPEGGRRDRDRLLQDAAHPQGRGQDQARGQEGQQVSAAATVVDAARPRRPRTARSSAPRTSGAPTSMGTEEIHALRGVSFTIEPGEYVADHGPVGLGQVDAHEPHRLPGHAQPRAPTSCAARSSRR